jgi:hypothetical protein
VLYDPTRVDLSFKSIAQSIKTLEAQAAIFEISGETIDVDLHLKTSDALRDALAEIARLRSDADALPLANAEIERLRSDAELHRTKVDRGMSSAASTFWAIDWFVVREEFRIP